jgi:hypothetical protein
MPSDSKILPVSGHSRSGFVDANAALVRRCSIIEKTASLAHFDGTPWDFAGFSYVRRKP